MTDYFSRALQAQDQQGVVEPVQAAPQTDYFSRALGTAQQAKPINPNAEPDAPSWLGRRWQDIRGKQDPRFKDLPEFINTPGAEKVGSGMLIAGKTLAGDDDVYGDVIAKGLGDRLLKREKDANGYEIVTYRGDDGQPIAAYVNRPGMNLEDLNRTGFAALPYIATGGPVGAGLRALGANWLTRGVGLGLTAGATSMGVDKAAEAIGSQQPVSLERAAVATAMGPLAEGGVAAGSALWRRFVTEPGLFDRATGTLTQKGLEEARKLGINPDELTNDMQREFAKTYAKSGPQAAADVGRLQSRSYEIPASRGQSMKDPQQLHMEEAMRRGIYGQDAKGVMQGLDNDQAEAITNAAIGGQTKGGKPSVPTEIAPRSSGVFGPEVMPGARGEQLRGNVASAMKEARNQEKAAWKVADDMGPLRPTQGGRDLIGDVLDKRLVDGDVLIDTEITPIAARMVKELERYAEGAAPEQVSKLIKSGPEYSVQQMRKRLVKIRDSAQTPEDGRAARAVYEAFDDWIDQASNKMLMDGDPLSAAAMRTARDATRTLHEHFAPKVGGKETKGAKLVREIMDENASPEAIVTKLFGSGSANPRTGTTGREGALEAVKLLKNAYQKYLPEDQAARAMDDLRIAYWMHNVQDKGTGKAASPKEIVKNVRNVMMQQRSLFNELFEREQQGAIFRFLGAMERVTYVPPNPSGTSYGNATFAKQFLETALSALGLKTFGPMVARYTNLPNVYGSVKARQAVTQSLGTKPAGAFPPAAIVGVGSQENSR